MLCFYFLLHMFQFRREWIWRSLQIHSKDICQNKRNLCLVLIHSIYVRPNQPTNHTTTAAHYIIYFLPDQTLSNSSSPIFTAFEKQFYLPVVYNSCICLFENIQPVPLWRQHEMSLTQKFANIHITLTQTPSSRTMNSGTTHRQGSWDHQSCCCLKELCLKGAGINTKHGGILIHFVSTALSLFFTSLFF